MCHLSSLLSESEHNSAALQEQCAVSYCLPVLLFSLGDPSVYMLRYCLLFYKLVEELSVHEFG